GGFPKIDITVSLHQGQACLDSAFIIHASPAVAGIEPTALGLLPAAPNPFRSRTVIGLNLGAASRLDLGIFDARGRAVGWLGRDFALEAGPHTFTWDGRRDDGKRARAGFYYVRAEAGGREFLRRVVLLD